MDKTLAYCLLQLGCHDKHIKFYRANLELGADTLMNIAKKARLQRSTAYLIAAEMTQKGLIDEDHKTYKKLYTAIEPAKLLQKLEAKHRQIGRSMIAFKEVLPELQAAHQTTTTRPRVRTYSGKQGLVAVLKDILSVKQEVLVWTNQHAESLVFDQDTHDQFIKQRIAMKIPIRVLAVDNDEGRELLKSDDVSLRQTKLLPKNVVFTSEIYIYGNKIAILDIGKDIFGVITENEQIAASKRAIFDLVWAQNQ